MNLKEELGIPKNDGNLSFNQVVNSVVNKFQPEPPKVSSISGKEFSMIDPNNQPSVYLLEGSSILFSNMIFVNAEDKEKLSSEAVYLSSQHTLFTTKGDIPLNVETIYIPDDNFKIFNENNLKALSEYTKHCTESGYANEITKDMLPSVFIGLTKCGVKGLRSISIGLYTLKAKDVLYAVVR